VYKRQELPLFKVAEERRVGYEERELPTELKRLVEELLKIEISTTTPLEALMILSRLKELAKTVKIEN
jgi:DNA mismatch repair protein MutS